MRRAPRAVLAALAGGLALVGGAPGAPAAPTQAPGPTLVEVCSTTGVIDIPELGPRTCVSLEAGSVLFASICGQLLPPEACAGATDGNVVGPAVIDAFEGSWLWRALRLQDRLDDGEPLRASLWAHTHNSSNSTAYAPSVSNLDPNQRYSITDQLRMGVRAIELDLHWAPNPAGTADTGGKAVVLCHGRSETVGELIIHLGCSVDRLFTEGLAELRAFLDASGNESEVVVLYLENQLDDDPQAHDLAAAALDAELGGLVYRPPAGQPCAEMPLDRTTEEILATGARVLIVGNCGPGGWGEWVHERGARWDERSVGDGYPPFPACIEAERGPGSYDDRWSRIYEDSTWLSAMVDGRRSPMTPELVAAMVRCGVDMIGFDRLQPADGRLEALVWSWAPDEPADDPSRRCVGADADGRFRMAPCGDARRFACRAADGSWVVPADARPAAEGEAVCAAAGARPATPPTGWENERLRAAAAGEPVWLSLTAASLGLASSGSPDAGPTPAAPPAPVEPTGTLARSGAETTSRAALAAILLAAALARPVLRRASARR